jgi:hypothetical protein
MDDTIHVGKGGVYAIDVLANDNGVNLQPPEILTQPAGGTVIRIGTDRLAFMPNTGYDGDDSFTYRACDGQGNCAVATVVIIKMPDNFILESACASAIPFTTWSIREAWRQRIGNEGFPSQMNVYDDEASPSVGDLDGDGIAEIVNISHTFNHSNLRAARVQVRRGTDGLLLASDTCRTSHNGINMPTLVDLNRDGKGEILVYDVTSRRLIALTFTRISATEGTLTLYKTSSIVLTSEVVNTYNVGAYDFNGDGRTEILVGPYVFNDNLVLLAKNSNETAGLGFIYNDDYDQYVRKAIAADLDNDGKLEIIAGCYTFKVDISNPDGQTGNSITQLAYSGQGDGMAAVADMDGDGDLDVIVVNSVQTYVWDGATNAFMGGETHSTAYQVSPPLIADVDGDGQLEILYNRSWATQCLRYNNGGDLSAPWSEPSLDEGGGHYMVAFDFDNDGAAEIVLRDREGLYVMDGKTRSRTTISLAGGTLIEYPVVADVDGDGEAEILSVSREGLKSNLICFESGGDPWLYARPVWNQYMYSGVNINDNLTVPLHPVNPAKVVFPNGRRPLNNFMQQHSLLSINGGELVPITILPDLTILSARILSVTASQLAVEMNVLNLENAVAPANIPVALSVKDGDSDSYMFVNSQDITSNIAPGTTATVTLVYDIAGYAVGDYRLTVNAGSDVFPDNNLQEECDYANNIYDLFFPLPDNIDDAECRTVAPPTVWGIRELTMNTTTIDNYQQILTGDIDGDGEVEIIAAMDGTNVTGSPSGGYDTNGLRMFAVRGNTVVEKDSWTFTKENGDPLYVSSLATCAIARYGGEAYIVIAATNGYLYAYDYDGTCRWESDQLYTGTDIYNDCVINIADFNGDSIPEIYAGKHIFSLVSGHLLCNGSAVGNASIGVWPFIPAVADMDGDGKLELVAGNQIFKVTINDPDGTNGNSISLMTGGYEYSGALPANIMTNGHTHVADFDLDGKLEVLVVTLINGKAGAYLWKPEPGGTATLQGSYVGTPTSVGLVGPALIGNIDSDRNPEAVFIANGSPLLMFALKYDPSKTVGNRLVEKWTFSHTDGSGCTGMSLFDFNSDGVSEICYRDQRELRIINGSGTSATVAAGNTFTNVTSGTRIEMPVIADVDGDGEAELIINGHTSSQDETGYLRVFKSNGGKWAPARRVWNTYSYRALNVNDDLTVPARYISPATRFAGPDGVLDNGDDVFPFNNLFQQQTSIDLNGVPLWTLPRATVDSAFFCYDAVRDSMYVTLDVINDGDAPLQAPFRIAVYKNTVGNAMRYIYVHPSVIAIDDTARISFGIPAYLASWGDATQLFIRLNDTGNTFNDQEVCDSIARDYVNTGILLAIHDRAAAVAGLPVLIDVLANDSIPDGCTPALSIVAPFAGHGSVTLSGDSVQYVSDPGFAGRDTLAYRIVCGSDTATANIYVHVAEAPDNLSDADCYIDPPAMTWGITPDWISTENDIVVYVIPLVGDLNGDTIPEIVCFSQVGQMFVGDGDRLKTIVVYDGRTHARIKTISLPAYISGYDLGSYGLIRTPDRGPLIVVATDDYKIRAYNLISNAPVWETVSGEEYGSVDGDFAVALSFADFNQDGFPEIYLRDKIYNASTGRLLATATGGYNKGLSWGDYTHATVWKLSVPFAADVTGDSRPELILGNEIYEVNITNTAGTADNTVEMIETISPPAGVPVDGHTQVADFNLDGHLDVFISNRTVSGHFAAVYGYVWDVYNHAVSAPFGIATNFSGKSIPLIADVDNDKTPEVVIQCGATGTQRKSYKCYKYDPAGTGSFLNPPLWEIQVDENTFSNGLTLFDFNQDGENEVLSSDHRNINILRGIDGTPLPNTNVPFGAGTAMQYPVIAAVSEDGSARIISIGRLNGNGDHFASLNVFKSSGTPWAPARRVWNQYMYNAANVNEDLSIPAFPVNPATVFPGNDGLLGTPDDVQPYNNFIQQQTSLSIKGTPLWLMPDATFDESQISTSVAGDSVSISICIINRGDAVLGSPVYATLYKDSVDVVNNIIATGSLAGYIQPGDTACMTIGVRDIRPFLPFVQLVVRLNDNGVTYPVQDECHCDDSTRTRLSPALHLMMKKNATLNGMQDNGTYPNPVAILFRDSITYEITAVNASLQAGPVTITDTLPPYLKLVAGSAAGASTGILAGTPPRDTISWKVANVGSLGSIAVSYRATPEEGASASQSLFINRAWVASDTVLAHTNDTYHQGAGISVVTFSASAGGQLYGAEPQALDFKTSPRAGVLAVADEGYEFAGWSHGDYVSLRGDTIRADSGILRYGDIVVYGDVELRAVFVPVKDQPAEQAAGDKAPDRRDHVWANGSDLYIRTKKGTAVHIYSSEGILRQTFTTDRDGLTGVRLERGIYIVTLDGGAGYKAKVDL